MSRLEPRGWSGIEHVSRRVAAAQLPVPALRERVQSANDTGTRAGSTRKDLQSETNRSVLMNSYCAALCVCVRSADCCWCLEGIMKRLLKNPIVE